MPVRSGKVRSSSQPRRGAASSTERANKNTRIVARQPATASTEGPPKKRRKRGLSKKKGASASDGRSVGRVSKTAQPIQEKLHFDKDVVAALPKPWQKLLSTNTDASPSQTSQSSQVDLSALQDTVKTIGSMLNQMTQPVLLELVRRRIVSAGGTGVDSELKKYSQKRNSKKSPLKSVIVKHKRVHLNRKNANQTLIVRPINSVT